MPNPANPTLVDKFARQERTYQQKRRQASSVHQHIGAGVDLFRARLAVLVRSDPRAADRMASAFVAHVEQLAREVAAVFVTVGDTAPHTAQRTPQSVGGHGGGANARARTKRTAPVPSWGRGNRT